MPRSEGAEGTFSTVCMRLPGGFEGARAARVASAIHRTLVLTASQSGRSISWAVLPLLPLPTFCSATRRRCSAYALTWQAGSKFHSPVVRWWTPATLDETS